MLSGRPTIFAMGLGLLGASGCETYQVGPDVLEQYVSDPDACDGVGQDPPCPLLEVDNAGLAASPNPQLVLMRFGFEAPRGDMERLFVRYETPGGGIDERQCPFATEAQDFVEGELLRCLRATLDGGDLLPRDSERGTLALELDVLATEPGPHALSVWIRDGLELESTVLRWQFTVAAPPGE